MPVYDENVTRNYNDWAMANGCEEARACTPLIAPPNSEDGVAQIIERYLSNGEIGALRV